MAYSLNRAQIIGNMTRDPELRKTPSGTSVAGFSIATNHAWTDANGQKQEKAEFHNIVAWGKLAEIVTQYTKKGSKVYVDGRMQTRDWTGDDGVKRYRTEIVAENLIILDSRGGASGGAGFDRSQQPIREKEDIIEGTEDKVKSADEITVDDLPF
ncbi:MAG: hypothetical protein ACD_51C00225G0003 [uncultured bacterium]|nr:MAG: hypothetical protein ACD_51C00225G0003 [uncultured bacterium]OGJ48626.1 MAG: hypothetical protein A2344_04985 [Candidatus Peregrinibacteria bacterium RIFOXYB12_FULL_41_12]OGJ48717.1 MAG: hypothetical protein A2244_03410 [Candidatus Peregrinibacteria bacterium RIFOXYA2_FULL_41_18]OGJ53393.1 MAG: hypothetical protein A2448_03325 [Candidatus Peregrinibacteria bacterium RIFOXYC2_FULL_41_22]OGJ54202.1 MAG: hypothetical protein A2336_00800 [Candidatus Peregrinibacteria bacterium RIFOXYB2_FULL